MFKWLALKMGTTSSSSLSKPSSSSNLSCSEYEPLSLAASASAHSLFTTFDVFLFGAFFAFEKGTHDLLRFFLEDIFQTNRLRVTD